MALPRCPCLLALLFLLHAATSLPHNGRSDGEQRIVGGTEVEPGSLPYMVALYMEVDGEGTKFHCGAVVISEHHILTAAHCVQGWNTERFTVVLGAHDLSGPPLPGQTNRTMADITMHEFFYFEDFSAIPVNDIAILRVETPLVLGVDAVALSMVEQDEPLPVGELCTVSGWGSTQEMGPVSPVLLATEVPVQDRTKCVDVYELRLRPSMMCAGYDVGGYDACAGDSGGPLVCGGRLQGLVSWGEGCAEPLKYGVYTNIAYFRDWVEKHNYVPQ